MAASDNGRDDFHVVLVEPANSLNIGAVVRAMRNLGFPHLHLVAPIDYDADRASVTARGTGHLLDTLQIHATLDDAIADMQEVVGFALIEGKKPAHHVTLPQWSSQLATRARRKTALVFGPEDNGLREEHLTRCRWIVRIPCNESFSAFNLAQSVLIALYDITQKLPDAAHAEVPISASDLANANTLQQLERHLDSIMEQTGFVRPGSPRPVPGTLKSLFRRLDASSQEMGILLALFARINTNLQRQHKADP